MSRAVVISADGEKQAAQAVADAAALLQQNTRRYQHPYAPNTRENFCRAEPEDAGCAAERADQPQRFARQIIALCNEKIRRSGVFCWSSCAIFLL